MEGAFYGRSGTQFTKKYNFTNDFLNQKVTYSIFPERFT